MPHFFLKLIPPRPNFAADLSDAEKALMQAHAGYWSGRQEKGEVVVFGPVMDPKGAYGIGVIAAADEAGARAFIAADPVMLANCGFACEIHPMRAVTREAAA